MTTALVISGGGDKGAFAVGAIEHLLEKGFHFDVISGTSTGALIAPLLAIGDTAELIKLYTTVKKRDIIRWNWRGFWKAWYSTRPLEKLIRRTMKGERYDALLASSTEILLCSVDFQSGEIQYFSQRGTVPGTMKWENFDEFVAAVLASTNQPMIMPCSMLRGHQCYDGGVREIAPLRIISGVENLEKVVVISNEPAQPEKQDAKFQSYLTIGPRALDLMTAEILINDYTHQALPSTAERILIRPPDNLPSNGLEFVPKVMQEMRETGRKVAESVLSSS